MGKILAAAVAAIALLVYAFHSHGASAAKVGSCLKTHGATVTRSKFFEEAFGLTADDQQLPKSLKKELEDAQKHLYDVSLGPDSGLLMDTKRAHQEARLLEAAAAQGFDVTPQSRGKVMLIWFGGPSAEARAIAGRCL